MADSGDSIVVDSNNFVYVQGVRIARLVPASGSLQFLDRDRRRSEERGTRIVEVRLSEVAKLLPDPK